MRDVPTGPAWVHEPKVDGFRVQAAHDGKRVTLYSRNGSDFTSRYPSIVQAVERVKGSPFLIDGEIVAIGPNGIHDFPALLRAGRGDRVPLELHIFDLLVLRGIDLREHPLIERREKLAVMLRNAVLPLRLVVQFDYGLALLEAADGCRQVF